MTLTGTAQECPQCGGETEEADRLVGSVFAEKYQILSVLGSGGMSIVYKARHKYMNRIVAVKLLLEHLHDDKTSFARFQKEAEAASSLSHQNIVSVHDFGVEQPSGQAYFVMDCLEGDSLQDWIFRDGGIPVERAVDVFRQVCDGLAHAHKKGVVHRDLKPSNIVMAKEDDGSETVKIVDFGLAKLHRPENEDEARLTQSGMVFGSPLYMSPEQCQGYKLDARSDIYSMGVLMYEALTGTLPFKSDSFFNIALLHVNGKPPAFVEKVPNKTIPSELEKVVMKCLEKDPDQRYQTADELRQKILDSALLCGVPGLKAGAVVVADGDKKSAFRSTFENMRAVLTGPHGMVEPQKPSLPRALILSGLAAFLLASAGIFFFYPGIEGDHATPYQKLRWQVDLTLAGMAIQHGDYGRADEFLKDGKALALNFADRHQRLRMTVEKQAELYAAWGKFDLAEQANQETSNILTEQVIGEAQDVKSAFETLGQNSSPAQLAADRSHAIAELGRVITGAKRLHSRNLFKQEELLLKLAKDVLEKVGLGDSPQMAEVDLSLADCLVTQQRLPEVREILVDAVDALQKTAEGASEASPARKKYIRAELRLGQFDRDQSNFAAAGEELADALAQARKYAPSDRILLAECLNSYADELRQTGKNEEAAALVIEAKQYHE
jgi:serine/threonine protein kinase